MSQSGKGQWVSVSLPRPLIERVDRVWRRLGYGSRAEYIRMAVQAQLRLEEAASTRVK